MQKLSLLIVILALSIECRFQEPAIIPAAQAQKMVFAPDQTNIDAYTSHKINNIIQDISNKQNLSQGDKISLISEKFLGTPYQANRLHGSEHDPEKLVVDFRGLDCFTYLDYVAALQISDSREDFFKNIVKTRYINSDISFYNRKHFFTDWGYRKYKVADDITAQLSPYAMTCKKSLNEKTKGEKYLPGIPIVSRNITYIPGSVVDTTLVSQLKSGDFIGIYSPLPGLDVSHVGLFIITDQGPVFRHASSRKENQRVIDSPFIPYVSKSPGMVVLRALPPSSPQ